MAFSFLLFFGAAPIARADNVVDNQSTITMDAGTSNSDLRVKIVSNTAQSQSGDPVPGCNIGVADDGFTATVTLLISPTQGLTASPNPIIFDECGKVKTVTLTATIGGTYTITAQDPVVDNAPGNGVYHLDPFGLTVVVVDTTPPETTIDSGPDNPTALHSAEFTFSANEAGSTFECSLDGAAFVACDSDSMTSYSDLAVGDHTFAVRATDPSGNTDPSPASYSWTIIKLDAEIQLSVPELVTGETKFVASGTLKDTSTGEGIDGLTIEFTGDGAPGDVTTQGVTFDGVIEVESCNIGPGPSECVLDDIGTDPVGTDNIVLHLMEGGKVTFPPGSTMVRIVLQDMGTTDFTYTLKNYEDVAMECADSPGVVECPVTFNGGPLDIIAESSVTGGIKEITFSPSVDIGIAAIATSNRDSNPQDLLQINFEELAVGSRPSGFTVNSGSFFAFSVAQLDPANGLSLTAHLVSNGFYEAPDASVSYNVVANLQEDSGVGGEGVSGAGTSLVKRGTSGDLDKDGLGDTDEGNCLARNPSNTAQTWTIAPSPSYASSSDCPKKGGVADSRPDLYYEVDCMAGVVCPTQANLDLLEKAFDDPSSSKDINAHFHLSDTGICGSNQNVVAWSNADADLCNDYKSIKLNYFGTGTERSGGCTLASDCGTLLAKAQAVRYILIVYNINDNNACGATGKGELYGNDVIVGTECIFAQYDPTNRLNAALGTILHEAGHNNGLGHGGGKADNTRDDTNCKPNHVSVMNYMRQVPTTAMIVQASNTAASVNWYQGYHRGQLTAGGNAYLTENSLVDSSLVMSGTWKNRDGVTTITSFKILWGDPKDSVASERVKAGTTGVTLKWDGGEAVNRPTIDLNYMDVFIGAKQLPACTQVLDDYTTLNSPPDELVTMRNNMYKFQSTGAGTTALGLFDYGEDPDARSELNLEGVLAIDSLSQFEFLGVKQPLTNVAFGESGISQHKKGNTIPVQFNFNDKDGNPVTGANALSTYHIVRIDTRIALITDFTTPPGDDPCQGSQTTNCYFTPQTSTQPGSADYFTWDGSKWSFQMGTKNLQVGGTYAGRIYLHFEDGGVLILDQNGDIITYLFKVVKG